MSVAIRNTCWVLSALALTGCGPSNAELVAEAYQRLQMQYPQGVELGDVEAGKLSDGSQGVCGEAVGYNRPASDDLVFAYRSHDAALFISVSLREQEFEEIERLCGEFWRVDAQ